MYNVLRLFAPQKINKTDENMTSIGCDVINIRLGKMNRIMQKSGKIN